jgi:hypothetical protein
LFTKKLERNKKKKIKNKALAKMAPVTITPKKPNIPARVAKTKKVIARFNILISFKLIIDFKINKSKNCAKLFLWG